MGSTEVGSQSGRGQRICEDLYVTGTGFKNYLTLMIMMMMMIIIITMTKMIMVIMMTMMIYLFRAADNDMSISELHMENKLHRLNKIFRSTHKLVRA